VWEEPDLDDWRPPIQYETEPAPEPQPIFRGARGGPPEGWTLRKHDSDDDFILATAPPRGPEYEQSYIPKPEPAPEPLPVPVIHVPENLDEIINDPIAQEIIALFQPPPEPVEIPLLFPELNNEPIPEPQPEIRQALIDQIPDIWRFLIRNPGQLQREAEAYEQEQTEQDRLNREREERTNIIYEKENIFNDYEEWKAHQDDREQVAIIDNIKATHDKGNNNYAFYRLNELNEHYSNQFFVLFENFWRETIGELPADHYIIRYKLLENDHWITSRLDRDTWERMLSRCHDQNYIFDNNQHHVVFQHSGEDVEISINTFEAIEILRIYRPDIPERRLNGRFFGAGTGEHGGADFRYICKYEHEGLKEYLKRLEIGTENKRYSCFVYALLMAGVDIFICDKI
jgi:hypothetical protein